MALYLDVEKEKPLLIIGKLFPQNEETLGFPGSLFLTTRTTLWACWLPI